MLRRVRFVLAVASVILPLSIMSAEPEKVRQANYPNAFKYSREFVQQFSYDTSVTPNWIGKSDNFWYVYRTSKGTTYWKVFPNNKSRELLFDHAKLAAALSEQSKKPIESHGLSLSRVSLTDDGAKVKFVFDDYQYEYEIVPNKLTKGSRAPRGFNAPPAATAGLTQEEQRRRQELMERFQQQQQQEQQQQQQQEGQTTQTPARPTGFDYKVASPDKKFYVYAYKHNIYLAEEGKEKDAVQLSTDGEEDHSFAGGGFGAGGGFNRGGGTGTGTGAVRPADSERKSRVNATWSPDSQAFFVSRSDSRGVEELFLVDSIASPRPKLEKYKYPMPGEDKIRRSELFYLNLADKKLVQIKPKWKDERYFNTHWGKTASDLRFVRRDRLQRNIEFCSLDTKAAKCKCLFEEGIDNGNIEYQNVRYIDDTDEMIWWSERSGWGHFYLYNRDGTLKNAITAGPYRASAIVAVDTKNRTLYFRGNAREAGENVYYQHLYSVRFDGSGLTLLDPGDANHNSVLSPNNQVLVDNTSRVDTAPTSCLRDAAGNKIMDLEVCDLSRLKETGWKLPTTFVVKAADGVTDLYGNMWTPFDMDPKKQYPIIANVYPGPQTEGVTHTFAAHSSMMQMAQLGFIVIQVGHRGGTPTRSKAYHRYGYFNLRDYALEDKKSAIEQLALKYPFMDITRVGIYGHSGGGFMSAAAVLQKPYNDFFKAAVASAGNHDNNIYNDNWSERYHGMKEVPADQEEKKTTTTTATTGQTTTGTQGGGQGTRRRRPPEEFDLEYDEENEPQGTKADEDKLASVKKELTDIATKMATAKGEELDALEKQLAAANEKLKSVTKSGGNITTSAAAAVDDKELKDAKAKAADLLKRADSLKAELKEMEEKKSTINADQINEYETRMEKLRKNLRELESEGSLLADRVKSMVEKATSKKTEVTTKETEKKTETTEAKKEEEKKTKFSITVPTNAELAANLKGALLLVHGEIDNNVHPANTIRLVDALVKANKRFDMLILPGQRHGFGTMQPYFTQRMWDFFSDHLLGDRQNGADILEKKVGK
jgi:dipeptidyl-peptidase-4